MGYHQAGFDVIGIDIRPQRSYPFEFHQMDWREGLDRFSGTVAAVHASPPCQGYSSAIRSDGRWSHRVHDGYNTPQLIAPVREALMSTSLPYVIENVEGAKGHMLDPVMICGAQLGLSVRRHRLFESSFPLDPVPHVLPCRNLTHPTAEAWIAIDPAHRDRRIYRVTGKGRQTGTFQVWRDLMEMPWARNDLEMAEAVPPAYTRHIGTSLMRHLDGG